MLSNTAVIKYAAWASWKLVNPQLRVLAIPHRTVSAVTGCVLGQRRRGAAAELALLRAGGCRVPLGIRRTGPRGTATPGSKLFVRLSPDSLHGGALRSCTRRSVSDMHPDLTRLIVSRRLQRCRIIHSRPAECAAATAMPPSPADTSAEGCLLRFRRGLVASPSCCCAVESGGLGMDDARGWSRGDWGDIGIAALVSRLIPLRKNWWYST